MKTRNLCRPWWQEMLIMWLVLDTSVVTVSTAMASSRGGSWSWTSVLPGNPFTFVVMTFVWAGAFAAYSRRRRQPRGPGARSKQLG